jgi:rhamnulokinase
MMPDLLGYFLSGEKYSEYTNVTTSQLYDPKACGWDYSTIKSLELPEHIFTKIDRAGTLRGKLLPRVAEDAGLNRAAYAAVGTHDTASAVAAIPGEGSFAFCSSGTWSLFGVETEKPILTDEVYKANFSNEGTVQGGFRPLKNIMGLWIIQECRRDWLKQGDNVTWDGLVLEAEKAKPLRSLIDPDCGVFFTAGGMVKKIQKYCKDTNQPVPETRGEVARCIYESLALKYRWALERLEEIKGAPIAQLNIVGGGIQNKLLDRMAADSTGRPVVTGPVEGACIGNLLMQAVALGELNGINDVRRVVRDSVEVETFEPNRTQAWGDAYQKLLKLMEAKEF